MGTSAVNEPVAIEITFFSEPDLQRGQFGRWGGTAPASSAAWESFQARRPLQVIFTRKGRRYRGKAYVIRIDGKRAIFRGTGAPEEVN
jgi:hypothetical protein